MTEQGAKSLATVLAADSVRLMPSTRTWGVVLERMDGRIVVIEDHGATVYRDRAALDVWQSAGDDSGIVQSVEWGEWDDGYEWASGLASVLGSERYWNSGGNIWLVFFDRADGRFAVIGTESGGIYASYEEFDSDLMGEKAENHVFV